MGTNYYYKINQCLECSRFEKIHIGKSSFGWKFIFQAQEKIRSFEEYKIELKDKLIEDEYGHLIDLKDFIEMVIEKQNQQSHFENYREGNFIDYLGFEFSNNDFS